MPVIRPNRVFLLAVRSFAALIVVCALFHLIS